MYNGVLHTAVSTIPNCQDNSNQLDTTAFKGIFMWAVADWSAATRSSLFSSFDQAQATAIANTAIYNRAGTQQPGCPSATNCQLAFCWARLTPPPLITDATQSSALDAFINVLDPAGSVPGNAGTLGAKLRFTFACQGAAGQSCQAQATATAIEKLSADGKRITGVLAGKPRSGRYNVVTIAKGNASAAAGHRKDVSIGRELHRADAARQVQERALRRQDHRDHRRTHHHDQNRQGHVRSRPLPRRAWRPHPQQGTPMFAFTRAAEGSPPSSATGPPRLQPTRSSPPAARRSPACGFPPDDWYPVHGGRPFADTQTQALLVALAYRSRSFGG